MEGNIIVSIGRESGSGGRRIGLALAERLGVKCYDKELIAEAAKESGLAKEILENNDEVPTRSFLYSLVMDTYSMAYHTTGPVDMPIEQKAFLAQYNAIKKIAEEEGSAVFVGRCADYALEDNPDMVSVFITADDDDKVSHVRLTYHYTENQAKDYIQKTDKRRSNYYNYYSNKKWGDTRSYDLTINRSRLGFEGTVEAILAYIELFKKEQQNTTKDNNPARG
ncbi:MAG: cytidylate kinase-like family protein [Lachnospiraceae bacterium]|nr:cytidylate kinase-like family protein [Lachnospiraceae bacterium]